MVVPALPKTRSDMPIIVIVGLFYSIYYIIVGLFYRISGMPIIVIEGLFYRVSRSLLPYHITVGLFYRIIL